MNNTEIKFFQPLWKRYILLLSTVLWCGVEFWVGSDIWQFAALVLAGYVIWRYFINFPKAT